MNVIILWDGCHHFPLPSPGGVILYGEGREWFGEVGGVWWIKAKPAVLYFTRDLILGDDAPLYIADVMLIWAAPIPADRWHCSLWP